MKKFDEELAVLHKQLIDMGSLAEEMLTTATQSLSNGSNNAFEAVTESEYNMDQMQLDIDQEVVRLLTVYGPVATDLRYLLTVSKVTSGLERIGDQAVNICEAMQLMADKGNNDTQSQLPHMAQLVQTMLRQSLDAYINKNTKASESIMGQDDVIDSLNDQIARELRSDDIVREAIKAPQDIANIMAQILIARSLERIADQACNICEEVFYLVKGDDVRHSEG